MTIPYDKRAALQVAKRTVTWNSETFEFSRLEDELCGLQAVMLKSLIRSETFIHSIINVPEQ